MITTQEHAQLSLYAYDAENDTVNRPNRPQGWEQLEYQTDNGYGFSHGVFRRAGTNEIVIAYAGTNQSIDWITNLSNGVGLSSVQTTEAALVYLATKAQYPDANVSFTGHSLGGGLASVMAVWFDRTAVVFDEATFELTARNPLIIGATHLALTSAGFDVGAFTGFNGITDFSARETKVSNYYVGEEALQLLRMFLPTISGADNRIEFGVDNMLERRGDLHSQALLTAGLMSDGFRSTTIVVSGAFEQDMHDPREGYKAGHNLEEVFTCVA